MKQFIIVVAMLASASPAYAQFGGLVNRAQKAIETKQKIDDLTFSEEEEREIGEQVSLMIREKFGVVQDPAVHKYVALVGTVLTQQSSRPTLPWTFIVLDTDGVNAFASPGGFVHITRGALALIQNEAELAAVLGHEIAHVTEKHTVNAIRKGNMVRLGSDVASTRASFIGAVANASYNHVFENAYDRSDENESDEESVLFASKAGYKAGTLADFLARLAERNKNVTTKNGLFASHPQAKDRISRIGREASSSKASALVADRYKASISYEPTDITQIAVVVEGASGLTGGDKEAAEKKEAEKKEQPKKSGGLAGLGLNRSVGQEKQSAQVSASGGARGVEPDRDARGGDVKTLVTVRVSAAEVDAFKKGIV